MKALSAITFGIGLILSQPLLAETSDMEKSVYEKLDSVIQDPHISVKLETQVDGFVLQVKSLEPASQTAAKALAVEVLKQHNLSVKMPHSNGYGLPEQ